MTARQKQDNKFMETIKENSITEISNNPPHLLGALFWLHGTETQEELEATFMRAVESGIGEFTLESRPHADYLGPKWWSDLSLILALAKKHNVEIYIFDEKWYPSGVAGNIIQSINPAFKRMFVSYVSMRYHGPQKDISLRLPPTLAEESKMVGVYAYPVEEGVPQWNQHVVISANEKELQHAFLGIQNAVHWDVPEGEWLIVFVVSARDSYYIDPMNPLAVDAFIESTYEPTKDKFKEYFGNVIKGFFFDEPGYFSGKDEIPWTEDFADAFAQVYNYDPRPFLPLLWIENNYHPFKYHFHEVLNNLYAERYNKKIQSWCHNHSLKYIGHWYEHEEINIFAKERKILHNDIGAGPGDIFKAGKYVDEGGMDLVCNQVLPGEKNRDYWGMPKLASSIAHIYDLHQDLAFTETFGAYGWHAGLRLMKWITDWHAVRGINHFILHAINPKFPDVDCPPYYYDGGLNPQWKYFEHYTKYVNILSDLFRGGHHVAPLLLLHPGSSYYAGKTPSIEDVQRFLQEIQYDYDLVPEEVLVEESKIAEQGIQIKKEHYQGIIIPELEVITHTLLSFLYKLAELKIPIIFIYNAPHSIVSASSTDSNESEEQLNRFLEMPAVTILKSHMQLEQSLEEHTVFPEMSFKGSYREELRILQRVTEEEENIWLLSNEHVSESVRGTLTISATTSPLTLIALDPLSGKQFDLKIVSKNTNEVSYDLFLPAYRSLVLFYRETQSDDLSVYPAEYCDLSQINTVIKIPEETISSSLDNQHYTGLQSWLELDNTFSGTVPYTWTTSLDESIDEAEQVLLNLGSVHEIAEVYINDQLVGVNICPPYVYDIKQYCKQGENTFKVLVTNLVSNNIVTRKELWDGREESGENVSYQYTLEMEGGLLGPVSINY